MLRSLVVWMPRALLQQCAMEASAFYPRETGGTFMGYWSSKGSEAVITAAIPAGPNARRRLTTFEPDQQWQLEKIKEHYIATGRREVYLGDWHTHPDASSGDLSETDRAVLARIIAAPKARAPHPICLVCYGNPSNWSASIWVATESRRTFWHRAVNVSQASLQPYEV